MPAASTCSKTASPAAGHRTGWRAMTALVNAFGDQVVTPTAVGRRFVF
jgi:7,8-dihydropterin-6-yl-methyl-4-(beta-D-ribofuranosyl)aminobenzene 5'-phosphate synthase